MREILFRGKLPDGEWVEGYVVKGNCTYILTAENIRYMCVSVMGHANVDVLPVIPESIGQYTGMTDKNGKRIFEGDIVKYGCDAMVVVWQEDAARFALKFSTDGDYSQSISRSNVYLEVIGNIHDNPEMIGGTDDGK